MISQGSFQPSGLGLGCTLESLGELLTPPNLNHNPDHLNQNLWDYTLGISSASQTSMCTLITWEFVKIQTSSVGPGWVRPEISSKFSGGGADAAGLGHYFEEQGSSRVFHQHHCWHSGLSNLLLGEERAFLYIVRRLAASWLLPLGAHSTAHSTTLFPPQPRRINQKCLHILQNIPWRQNYFLLRAMAPVLFSYVRKQA